MIEIHITAFMVAAVTLVAILHAVSIEMRLADLTRRLESAERSLDRLTKVWWEGVARRNGYTVERPTVVHGGELPDEFDIGTLHYTKVHGE